MKPNPSSLSFDDADEFTPERMQRARLRVGLKDVSREEWQSVVQEQSGRKQQVNIALDPDVIAWFKARADERGYQALINAALREIMERKEREAV